MPLHAEFPNGHYGDPALLINEANRHEAILIDCGDLSRFQPKRLLAVDHVFVSHCHIDHFFGFDTLIRLLAGSGKTVCIYGPPDTADRVCGKLQGYTWNLVDKSDQVFTAVELDVAAGEMRRTSFRASDRFHPKGSSSEVWDPSSPVYASNEFTVRTALLDHRTPSLAYAVEEKAGLSVDTAALSASGRAPGAWLTKLKEDALAGKLSAEDAVPASTILVKRPRQKIVYATDGAANEVNHKALGKLIRNADVFYSETCFLEADRRLADETRHFTAKFIGALAKESGVRKLAPFHFSKRYVGEPGKVMEEARANFQGELLDLGV